MGMNNSDNQGLKIEKQIFSGSTAVDVSITQKSEEKSKKQSNSLKRIYSDSNCSYDSDNISSYENNSNCISVSSGSQRRLKEGDFLGSNVAQNENGNGLHNLHTVATECEDLLSYTHVQKKHKSL